MFKLTDQRMDAMCNLLIKLIIMGIGSLVIYNILKVL